MTDHFRILCVWRRSFLSVRQLEMTTVKPIFTNDALDHFVRNRVFRVRIGSVTSAINAFKVLVVSRLRNYLINNHYIKNWEILLVLWIVFSFFVIQFALNSFRKLFISAIASKLSFGVKFDQVVTFMAMVRTGQANAAALGKILTLTLGNASQTGIERLARHRA